MIPENIATHGGEIDDLFALILWITAVLFVAVEGVLVIFLIRYRQRPDREASFTHGSSLLESSGAVGTAVVLGMLVSCQWGVWSRVKRSPPLLSESLLVRVFAEQFGWYFVYAGSDGEFAANHHELIDGPENPLGLYRPEPAVAGTPPQPFDPERADVDVDDVISRTLTVPVDTDVVLELNALPKYDPNTGEYQPPVLHSFFAPNLRLKQDVVPFSPRRVWFNAMKTGTYEIACAELCGEGHYKMRADLNVVSDEEMEKVVAGWKHARPRRFPRWR